MSPKIVTWFLLWKKECWVAENILQGIQGITYVKQKVAAVLYFIKSSSKVAAYQYCTLWSVAAATAPTAPVLYNFKIRDTLILYAFLT